MTWSRATTPTRSAAARSRSVRSASSALGLGSPLLGWLCTNTMLCAPMRIGSRSASRGETGHCVSEPSAIFAVFDEPSADVQQDEVELLPLGVSERPHELV